MAKTRKVAQTTRKTREPKVGSDEWYAREQEKPGFALGAMKELCKMIAQGHASSVRELERWMAKFPDVARELALERLGDLCTSAEAAWVRAVAGDNPLDRLAVTERIAALKAELSGANPSLLERVLVSNVVTAHLAHYRAVLSAAQPAQQTVAAFRDRRVESTSRHLLLAVRSLAVVRQQQARGLTPRTNLPLFEARA